MFEFRRQPFKAVYFAVFALTALCIRLPYWIITAIPPGLRPRRNWTMGRTLIFRAMSALVETWYVAGMPAFPGQDPEKIMASGKADNIGFVWVTPIAEELVVGEIKELAKLNDVSPKKTFGYWYKNKDYIGKGDEKAQSDEKVVFHLHGGGYVVSTPHPQGGATFTVANGLLESTTRFSRIFAGGYRICSSAPFPARNAFPAALLDALAGYHYLLHTLGFRAENIIASGDSSGGHLAIALVRYLALHRFPDMPVPGALLLLSPMTDWCLTHTGKDSSMARNAHADVSVQFFRGYSLRSLIGNLAPEEAATNAWITPASRTLPHPAGVFAGFPKTYVAIGDAEMYLDSVRTIRDRLVADMGQDNVVYREVQDATHDFVGMSWHEPERTSTLKDIAAWLETL